MSAIKNITLREGELVRVPAGVYHAEPLIVEAGGRSVRVVLGAGARLHTTAFVFAVDSAASLSLTVDLEGEGAEFHLHGLYLASGSQRADIDVRVNHLVAGCVSRQLVKGIAADRATGSFAGMVHVARDAQRTDASQRSQNLQITDTAHIFTRPQLEIYADDVRCSHGASVGRLDEEAVYYMRQRGISESRARRMQMQGFVDEIINHCQSDTLRESLSEKTGELLDRF